MCVDNVPIGDIWLNQPKHLLSGLRDTNENAIVDLKKTEELQDFAGFGGDLVDTIQSVGGSSRGERRYGLTP